ncbi:hypothetical protein [Candidatus Midichloria mitochondrii]|uniref:hypothetical protein n=1 Tax=Candidatus Midichloria mitochondrii TaxID=234827 RepID=UPI0002FC3519|nr:hypothetical protein [Candidatus Midichloria mitochondrii]
MVYKQTLSNQGQNPLAAFKQLLLAGRGLIETAIGQLKEICQIRHHTASLAKQFLGRPLSQGSWLMSSTQYYLMEK